MIVVTVNSFGVLTKTKKNFLTSFINDENISRSGITNTKEGSRWGTLSAVL